MVPREYLNEIPEAVKAGLREVLIVQAEIRFDTDCILYTALCNQFAVASEHCYAPFYVLDVDKLWNLTVASQDEQGSQFRVPKSFDGAWRREQESRHAARLAAENSVTDEGQHG